MTALAQERLERLGPVTLEEIIERAGLLARVDRKYVVPLSEASGVLDRLPADARVLEIDGRREFGYRSTYLDTPERASFYASGRSHRGQWKVRGRCYLDTGTSWLEIKTKGPRHQTVKQRLPHPEVESGLTAEGGAFVAAAIGTEAASRLQPVLVTAYRRSTLLLPTHGSRVTIDVDLGWTSLTNHRDFDRTRVAIIETKSGSTPSEVDRALWACGHRPQSLSKYGVGMAALHPDLPRLKWHRTMERRLALRRPA